jgi:hypothetical protein
MDQISKYPVIPAWLSALAVPVIAASAALLYAFLLGTAIVKALLGLPLSLTPTALRIVQILSGLVGTVVSAGFSRGKQPAPVNVHPQHYILRGERRAAARQHALNLSQHKFGSLGQLLGFRTWSPVAPTPATREAVSPAPDAGATPAPAPTPPDTHPAAVAVGLLYFAVYFLVGAAALLVALLKPGAPELVANAGYVWAGTVASSAYTFFSVGKPE